jgi:hypothetical protein
VITRDGERLELRGAMSTRELTLTVAGLAVEMPVDEDSWTDVTVDAELHLDRAQVVALRDELNVWLQRGEPGT